MYLYSLTLQQSTCIVCAAVGNFSGQKIQEVVVSRGKIIELLKPDETGKMISILAMEVFGTVRSLIACRLTGSSKDYIVAASDSGRIVILEYNPEKNMLEKVHQETYGKTGCRRITPGQYLASDPKGRAVMIGGIEKQKFVYILNRDAANKLTISSPLEAHKAQTIIFGIVGVDVDFENPIFAALELDYSDADQDPSGEAALNAPKSLTYYELDLGLNHVVRKWSDLVDPGSNLLIAVPGGKDGPGGVLVCAENKIAYKKPGHEDVEALIPRRVGLSYEVSILITSFTTVKQKDFFFFLLQSEFGDLYKVMLAFAGEEVHNIQIKYFDTVPLASSLVVLRSLGFLFVASEFGNHCLYQFQSIGDDMEEEELTETIDNDGEPIIIPLFKLHPLRSLNAIDETDSLAPIIQMHVGDLAKEDASQIYNLCGRGTRSSLRVLRHGLPMTEMAVSELPANPNGVWTVKRSKKEEFDSYIVVSFQNATLVLSIGETVEEVTDSGFLATSMTLSVSLLGDDALLQVHPNGIRHIRSDARINEWKPPGKKSIVKASVNNRQVVIALSGGEVYYFELDTMGQLIEVEKKDMGYEVACLEVGPIPSGRQRCRFLAVGGWDNTVRVLSLDPEDVLTVLSVQAVPSLPEAIAIVEMERKGEVGSSQLYLNVGIHTGVLMRTFIDSVTGVLSDTRTRFLGAKPVKLVKVLVRESQAVLAMSSRSWLCYDYLSRFSMTPMWYDALEHAASFSSDQCPEGFVAIVGNTLRILTTEKLGEMFNQQVTPLHYTPRKMIVHPPSQNLVIIETDHNAMTFATEQKILEESHAANMDSDEGAVQVHPDYVNYQGVPNEEMPRSVFGLTRAGPGRWASGIRILDPREVKTLQFLELEDNEAAFSCCMCTFHDNPECYLIVGTAKDLQLSPRACAGGFVTVYRITDENRLQLVHKTAVDDVPGAMAAFNGRLLVGVGHVLRIYDLGKRKLLRKCETRSLPNFITSIDVQGDRIYVSDMSESFHLLKYHKADNQLYTFADDTVPRWLTAHAILDYDTLAGADKFGNFFVARLPNEISDDIEDDPTGAKIRLDHGVLNGAPHKVEEIIQFHVGEMVHSLQKTALQANGEEAVVYSTIAGGIGAFLPFTSREDIDFFSHLEMHMRQEAPSLVGREHLSYRSAYFPVKDVVDGDLCEQFTVLDAAKQKAIAEELDRSPGEVAKKLEDMRNRLL